jgi:hypothetical protein
MPGGGSRLLKRAVSDALEAGIHLVTLDDTSDRFHQPHNLFLKAGMHYVADGYPEMIGDTRIIVGSL